MTERNTEGEAQETMEEQLPRGYIIVQQQASFASKKASSRAPPA